MTEEIKPALTLEEVHRRIWMDGRLSGMEAASRVWLEEAQRAGRLDAQVLLAEIKSMIAEAKREIHPELVLFIQFGGFTREMVDAIDALASTQHPTHPAQLNPLRRDWYYAQAKAAAERIAALLPPDEVKDG